MRNVSIIYKKVVVILLISLYNVVYAQKGNEKVCIVDYQVLESQKAQIKKGNKEAVKIQFYNKIKLKNIEN